MNAVAGLWNLSGSDADVGRECDGMLSAQAAFGPDGTASRQIGNFCLGRNLYRLLPEDRFDRQPLISADGRFALVADLRLDNREEIASALGIPAAERSGSAD